MKKNILTLLAVVLVSLSANSQVMKQGDHAVNFGIGIPNVHGNPDIKIPALTGAYDIGVTDKLGIGYISGGAFVGFSMGGNNVFNTRDSYLTIGPRAAYHFDFVSITGNSAFDELDIYAGVLAGFEVNIYKDKDLNTTDTYFNFANDMFVGIRYTFAPGISVFGEAGYGVAYVSGGISLRL